MDDTLDFVENKEVVLAQIDRLHEEHRLRKLRELVDEYNQQHPSDVFKYDDTTPVEELICIVLRLGIMLPNVTIPSGLTFGEPYDSHFVSSHLNGGPNLYVIPKLFKYADQLPMFLIYMLERLRGHDWHHHVLKREIWKMMPALSKGEKYRNIEQLQRAIRQSSLSKTDIVFLSLLFFTIQRTLMLQMSYFDFIRMMERIS